MTPLINTQDIEKSYGIDSLFSGLSLGIFAHERLGLIGPNGSGKSTLLKILMGMETPDKGKVSRNTHTHLVYLAQEDQFDPQATISHILFGGLADTLDEAQCRHQIWQITGAELFPDLGLKIETLSGGWQKRLAIVQALLQKPDLLLMDEPTNHLDLEGIIWLEQIINKTNFAFVLVSHDRYFLENTVNSVMELNKLYAEGYFKCEGKYSNFLEKREKYIEEQLQRKQSLANKLRREEEWLQRMPKARSTKAQYRIDQAEQLKTDFQKVSTSLNYNKTVKIDFTATNRKTKKLLAANNLSITRNEKPLFKDLNLLLSPQSCLGLLGKNGSGKSTLIHLLNGDLMPDNGNIERADNLRIVLFDQKRQQLNQNQTLLRALAPAGDSVFYHGQTLHVAAWAKRFLFTPDQLQQSVSRLSGGEQARVLIANLMLQPADILLLDEPTNDLDIPSLEVLEESLHEFPGAIVLITHDRFLLDRLSDQLLYLDGNGTTEFFANYAQWQQSTHSANRNNSSSSAKTAVKNPRPKAISYEEQRELGRLPDKIQKAELALEALEMQLQDAQISSDAQRLLEICNHIKTAKDKIDQLYQRWEELELLIGRC